MLNFNQDQKSQKIPSIFCADTEYLLEKIYTFDNDPTETNKQTVCGYSLFTNCLFDSRKCKHDFCRVEKSMKVLCRDLKEHTAEVINSQKTEILPLIKKKKKS